MRRNIFWLLAFIIASLVSLSAQPAFADPADDLAAVKKAFTNVGSVHIEIKRAEGSGFVDMVSPNKVHWSMSNGIQVIAIGQQSWEGMGGRWIEHQQPQMAVTLMQHLRTLNLEGSDIRQKYNVTDKGMATAAGAPAHKYHIVNKKTGDEFDLLVGSNHLPIQYISSDGETWTFSQYNSVADIKPPM